MPIICWNFAPEQIANCCAHRDRRNRPQQSRFRAIGSTQPVLGAGSRIVRKMVLKEHPTWVFPRGIRANAPRRALYMQVAIEAPRLRETQMLRDQWLASRCRRGDRRALCRVYEAHLDSLLGIAASLLGDVGLAEDVVQDVFVN